jgi:cold shock CspA family protein
VITIGTVQTGTVVAFDSAVGLGEVQGTDGAVYPFHCIEIADGSRDIPVGQAVQFTLLGKLGRFEAAGITRV